MNRPTNVIRGIVAAGALAVTLLASPSLWAGITGSKHDFREAGGGYPLPGITDICSTCHVPHKPLMSVPLWAHTLSSATYYLYNTNPSYTGPNTAAYDTSPAPLSGSMSRACLSCHDGTVAVAGTRYLTRDSSAWILYDENAQRVGGPGDPSTGLRGSHPIAVNYATVRANQPTEYSDISTHPSVKLERNKVQCVTCHNAHFKFPNMLVMANTNSALCLTCHNK